MPSFVAPQLATLVESAPEGDDWLHELKLDGYRILARVEHGKVQLLTRRGHDWSRRVPALVRALAALPFDRALIDGELCALRPDGVSDFQRLQNSLQAGRDEACSYFAFDLLYLGDRDLRALPLQERKAALRAALAAAGTLEGRVRYSDHVRGGGPGFFEHACELGAEGVVSKRAAAPYSSGRSRAWLKAKCVAREEFVIGGYSPASGTRAHFGALLLGSYDARGALRYAGKVGTGFTQRSLTELHERVAEYEQDAPSFVDPPRGAEARGVVWLRPELVAEVQYAERTADGLVRHASFQGLRGDKPARQVHAESRAGEVAGDRRPTARAVLRGQAKKRGAGSASRLRLMHPERLLYPECGITKLELAHHYLRVAPNMLPHVARRPLTLLRCPDGLAEGCFFQKHPPRGMPEAIGRVRVTEKHGARHYMTIDGAEGLVGLVQMGALEIHAWGSRVDALEYPDQLVFDLDPDDGLPWGRMIEAAQCVRTRLSELGLVAFLKATGGKGLHVVVPIVARTHWDEAKRFCKAVVDRIVRAEPAKYVATMSKAKRKGKVFLDYLRNGRGATSICVYSTRAYAAAPVCIPLAWDELGPDQSDHPYTLQDQSQRLVSRKGDPWRDFFDVRQAIPVSKQTRAAKRA